MDPGQNARVVLVAAIAFAIRVCLVRRDRARRAAAKLKTSLSGGDDVSSDDGYSSGYSSPGGFSRENSAHSFRDLLLASLEACSDEDTATTGSSLTDRTGLGPTAARHLYASTRRRVNNAGCSEEPDRGVGVAPTSVSYPTTTLPPTSQGFLLNLKDLREDLERRTTRGQLVNGKREPSGFPP